MTAAKRLNRKLLMGVALLAVSVIAGLLVWTSAGGIPHAELARESPTSTELVDPVGTVVSEGHGEQRDAPVRDPVQAAPAMLTEIRVVEKATGKARPGARVSFVEGPEVDWRTLSADEQVALTYLRYDPERYNQRYGRTVTADAEGRAWVPVHRGTVTGRDGRLYGKLGLDTGSAPEGGWVLALEDDDSLRVRVLRPDGQPAFGVPVVLVPLDDKPNVSFSHFNRLDLARTEAPEGIAVIGHLQEHYRGFVSGRDEATGWEARCRIPGWTGGGVEVDPWDPGPDPVTLTLPPTGTVYVTARDFDGTPLPVAYGFELRLADPMTGDVSRADAWTRASGFEGPSHRFDQVVAGRTYRAKAVMDSMPFETLFSGPTADGDVVRVDLQIDPEAVVLIGRAVEPGGRALSGAPLQLTIETSAFSGGDSTSTDAAGSFRIFLGLESRKVAITTAMLQLQDGSGRQAILASMGPFPAGSTDIGDVEFAPVEPEIAVSGEVLLDGRPHRAYLELQVEVPSREHAGAWDPLEPGALSFRRGAEGDFSFLGKLPAGPHRLVVRRGQWLPVDPIPFLPGERVVIQLQSGPSLTIGLRADPGLKGSVPLKLAPLAAQAVPQGVSVELGEAVEYRIPGLEPGPYRLTVLAEDDQQPVVTVEPVQVDAGEDNRVDVDLRGRILKVEIVVTGPGGRDVSGSSVLVRFPGSEEPKGFLVTDSKVTIQAAASSLDLRAVAAGYAPQERLGLRSDTRIELQPYPRVDLGVVPVPVLAEDASVRLQIRDLERRARIRASSWGPDAFGPQTTYVNLDRAGTGSLGLPNGHYRLGFGIAVRGRGAEGIDGFQDIEIAVNHEAGQSRFDFEIPGELIARTLAEILGR